MIGIIAGELIGSPYNKENLKGINDIFFPLFDSQTVIDPKTYKERTYKPTLGKLSDVALNFNDISDLSHISGKSIAEMLCGSIVFGDLCAIGKMDMKQADDMVQRYVSWFDEKHHDTLVSAFYAAYRLKRELGSGIAERLGAIRLQSLSPNGASYKSVTSYTPEVLSALLKGELVETKDGTYTIGDGKHDDTHLLDAAIYSVEHSSSFEEAVRKAAALGGNSSHLAAITGGLAELAYGVPEQISYRAINELDHNQKTLLKRYEDLVKLYERNEEHAEEINKAKIEQFTPISVLSLPGKVKVYSVPDERQDIINSIKKINKDSIFVDPLGMQKLYERVREHRDASGEKLYGTYIAPSVPQLRNIYFFHKDRKLYSASSLPVKSARGFMSLEDRLKIRNDFLKFIAKVEEIRDTQERKIGHNPEEGHICFASAWWVEVSQDKVRLMKGYTPYGEFGLDDRGRMRVNSNVLGGSFSGEYLQAALDNQKVFYLNDNATQVLEKIAEKCLDDGVIVDEEKPIPLNIDLMYHDLSSEPLQLKRAAEVSDDILSERTASTKTRSGLGLSSEAKTIDEAIYAKAHQGAVFTIGHSNLTMAEFIRNCKRNGITMVRDIRSWPHSRSFPHFNQQEFKESLEKEGIKYIYNGDAMGGHIRRAEFPNEVDGIKFTLSEGSYAQRTRENATRADITLAFAEDFSTAGEQLTAKAASGKYIAVPIADALSDVKGVARSIAECMSANEKASPLILNIAGNGMQTLAKFSHTQQKMNSMLLDVLTELKDEGINIRQVISGGQTGIDQAGIIAAYLLDIPSEVHAPKGWMMRGADGKDVFSECDFKNRFLEKPFSKDLSYQEMMATKAFKEVYDSIVSGARNGERQALMCAETSPTDCHRFACVGYALEHPKDAGRKYEPTEVHHIKRDGQTISQEILERKLCKDHRVEFNEKNLASVMKQAGERIQHPDPNTKPIRLSNPQPTYKRKY